MNNDDLLAIRRFWEDLLPGLQLLASGDFTTKDFRDWKKRKIEPLRQDLARRFGVPLDHRVEVWLEGEIRLRGILKLRLDFVIENMAPDALFVVVQGVEFRWGEQMSWVRLD